MQNAKLLIATLALTLLFVFGFSWVAQNWLQPAADPTTGVTKTVSPEELLTDSPHALGAGEGAEFTIVEFSDFQCPACQGVSGVLKGLVNHYPDKVRLVYRHFPLVQIHPTAYLLAEISEISAANGKFWEMHDFMYAHQAELSELNEEETIAYFQLRSEDLGLNEVDWVQLLESNEYQNLVEEDLRRSEMLQLSFTPSLFLNGQLMPIDQIESVISGSQTP